MKLLDQAQRRIYRGELNEYLEDRRRNEREAEYDRTFAHLDSELAAGNITQLRYDEVKNELAAMHEEEFGNPYDGEVPDGGPDTVIFRKSG